MGLLEKLSQDKPYTPQGVRYPRLFELVRKHFSEIQEALKKQEFKKSLFYNYYHKVKREKNARPANSHIKYST